jgi:hypothetical protein
MFPTLKMDVTMNVFLLIRLAEYFVLFVGILYAAVCYGEVH